MLQAFLLQLQSYLGLSALAQTLCSHSTVELEMYNELTRPTTRDLTSDLIIGWFWQGNLEHKLQTSCQL
jgi:hypothetical protein